MNIDKYDFELLTSVQMTWRFFYISKHLKRDMRTGRQLQIKF